MIGSTIWYIAPKFVPVTNPIAAFFWYGIFWVCCAPLITKLTSDKWFDVTAIPFALCFALGSVLATSFYILALNNGGKISVVSIIVEVSLILALLVGVFYFRESLNWVQILGIILSIIGIVMVVSFEK